MDLPVALTKSHWDKNKGLGNKLSTPDTGIGELLKNLKKAFDAVSWDVLDKKKAFKEADRDATAFEKSYLAAKKEASKTEKVADLLKEIAATANRFKAKIKHCSEVASEAEKFRGEVLNHASLDWDDERISLREAQEELDWYIDARARALKVAKALRKDIEKDLKTAKERIEDIQKAADDIQHAEIDDNAKKKLLVNVVNWAAELQKFSDDNSDSFNDKFAHDKDMLSQRQSPKHDIADALNKAGGDFNLQMVEVDAIQKSLRELDRIAAEGGGIVEECRDVLEADSRSVEDWKQSLNKTLKELTNLVRAMRDAREPLEGKVRNSEESHLAVMKDPKVSKKEKEGIKKIFPALVKEVKKQYDKFDTVVSSYNAKKGRVTKVPQETATHKEIKPLLAAFASIEKLVDAEVRMAKGHVETFKTNIAEATKL
ncbi:MAG: hypothetical protein U0939_12640 [Pirellulales bacterium]